MHHLYGSGPVARCEASPSVIPSRLWRTMRMQVQFNVILRPFVRLASCLSPILSPLRHVPRASLSLPTVCPPEHVLMFALSPPGESAAPALASWRGSLSRVAKRGRSPHTCLDLSGVMTDRIPDAWEAGLGYARARRTLNRVAAARDQQMLLYICYADTGQ
ncbi:hypothetical protein BV25DRAFT_675734 [Artomyces pyxidatus]|uniref:Uncharacterized protein n=1 Tax=Artomyces pyxidatus TaxID=48021 RepID=A0ACB8T2H8_9AGAM|nr:hypothetical protein BV25DRAFT_675734 [Artomyces pyxidatus]